ncbi:hypothetical protein NQ318_015560 [Aromia moschata]|uniref:Uncharacterized protein n=1 Tax=Aromia moschata TaxID=1265417 RepID=A0AAV8XKA6_9CUCU|nr:hypothetical protein NQ318_015560 [Aromia moschata]
MANLYPAEEDSQLPGNAIWFQQDDAIPHYKVNVRIMVNIFNMRGTAMGNSLSPFIANIFMSKFETEVKEKFEYFPRVWFRNVTSSRQLDAFESLEINKCNSSVHKDNGPIPISPLFALINKDICYGSVNRDGKFSINSASA